MKGGPAKLIVVWTGLPVVALLVLDYLQMGYGGERTQELMGALVALALGLGFIGWIRIGLRVGRLLRLPEGLGIASGLALGLIMACLWGAVTLLVLVNFHLFIGGRA